MESKKFVGGIRKRKRIPKIVSGFRIVFNTELAYEQLKAGAGIHIFSNAEFQSKYLTIIIGIHEPI